RTGRTYQLAYASARPDAVCHIRHLPVSDRGRTDTGDPAGRCRLDSTERKTLAWRLPNQRHDPHRDAGIAGGKLFELDGARHRYGIFRKGWRIAASRSIQTG